jgi:arginyl-tRNA synthetase
MMLNLIDMLKSYTDLAIKEAFGHEMEEIESLLPSEITQSTQKQFGHYQCNSPLKLAKALKKNPRQVATELVSQMALFIPSSMIEKLEIAGPGFINITLSSSFLSKEAMNQLIHPALGCLHHTKKERVIVEFSSPNIAKELHVGHLRSTIIGESLARVFEFLGYDVLRLNHVGDWGTQFGMLIAYLKKFHEEVFTDKSHPELSDLMKWYKESKKVFDEDPAFKKMAQEEVVALQKLTPSSVKAWERICDISRKAFNEIYSLLDVKIDERGESFYNSMLQGVVDDFEKKGLVTLDQGAKCVFLEGFVGKEGEPLPMILQKSDGGYNYSTTDMAAIKHRVEKEKADRIIYVVDAGQSLHFQMIFKAAEKVGYLDPKKTRADHVAFGVVLGADGKKFKTRSGETEKLIDLLSEAVVMAHTLLKERMPEEKEEILNQRAAILGTDAVKYSDLCCHRLKDYVFSYDRMLRFEGNTAAFLLYAFVRIQSIKNKVGKEITQLIAKEQIILNHSSEIDLALHLRQFGETLAIVEQELTPNRVCEYLFSLAEYFNAFFRDCRVEGSESENSRLLLCELTSRVLEKGLYVLGLKTLDKM